VKTTIDLPDNLLREAKQYAAREGIPLRAVFERGLEAVLRGSPQRRRFRLKTITTKGQGITAQGDWAGIRSLIYEGHGG
jgi:hypothetical protein